MIKVNLLPQRKPKRVVVAGEQHVAIGMAALALAGVGVYVAVHRPKAKKLADITKVNEELQAEVAAKQKDLVGFDELKTSKDVAAKRKESIKSLNDAQVVPAHVLQELGEILTPGRVPTMSEAMRKRVGTGPEGDPNRRFALDWDPHHVWMNTFTEKAGDFKIEGGAQSDGDVTQLAKRLQASVFFTDVIPAGAEKVTDKDSTVTYYKFRITGKLVY
jgi:Tfp pilus assembly protein PilN